MAHLFISGSIKECDTSKTFRLRSGLSCVGPASEGRTSAKDLWLTKVNARFTKLLRFRSCGCFRKALYCHSRSNADLNCSAGRRSCDSSTPHRPAAGVENVNRNQQVGRGVRDYGIAEPAAAINNQGVKHSGQGAGQEASRMECPEGN
jgi:hypothetical protein